MKNLDELTVQPHGDWNTFAVNLIEIDGHKYIVASNYVGRMHGAGAGAGGGIAIIHAESCPCKEKKNNEL